MLHWWLALPPGHSSAAYQNHRKTCCPWLVPSKGRRPSCAFKSWILMNRTALLTFLPPFASLPPLSLWLRPPGLSRQPMKVHWSQCRSESVYILEVWYCLEKLVVKAYQSLLYNLVKVIFVFETWFCTCWDWGTLLSYIDTACNTTRCALCFEMCSNSSWPTWLDSIR